MKRFFQPAHKSEWPDSPDESTQIWSHFHHDAICVPPTIQTFIIFTPEVHCSREIPQWTEPSFMNTLRRDLQCKWNREKGLQWVPFKAKKKIFFNQPKSCSQTWSDNNKELTSTSAQMKVLKRSKEKGVWGSSINKVGNQRIHLIKVKEAIVYKWPFSKVTQNITWQKSLSFYQETLNTIRQYPKQMMLIVSKQTIKLLEQTPQEIYLPLKIDQTQLKLVPKSGHSESSLHLSSINVPKLEPSQEWRDLNWLPVTFTIKYSGNSLQG